MVRRRERLRSGEDLAAALFALAGAIPARSDVLPRRGRLADIDPGRRPRLRGSPAAGCPREPGGPIAVYGAKSASVSPRSWSVRSPGRQLLPPNVSGRSGWTIRNSVTVLHRTEDAIARLREDAVAMAFLAAAEACGRGRPAPLERRHRDSGRQRSYWRSRSSTSELSARCGRRRPGRNAPRRRLADPALPEGVDSRPPCPPLGSRRRIIE